MQERFFREEQYKYVSVNVPLKSGGKLFIYFKRYNPTKDRDISNQSKNLYEMLQTKKEDPKIKKEMTTDFELPAHRTLLAINFDKKFEEQKVKKLFQILGKIRKVYVGDYVVKQRTNIP